MRVFVTGATGFVGTAVVADLQAAGHTVVGLARSDTSAAALAATGAEVLRGDLNDLDALVRGATGADGVIHCGFIHDWSDFAGSCETDRLAIATMADALAGTNKPLVVSSGMLGLVPAVAGALADEDAKPHPGFPRASESVLAWAAKGVRATVVRLPPSVHGKGDHGFVPLIIGMAKKNGEAVYVGDGTNLWSAVHRTDAAHLYRLALEKGAAGSIFHAVGDEGVALKDIAGVIAKHLKIAAVSKSAADAPASLGFMAQFSALGATCSSTRTRKALGWAPSPSQPGLLADMEANYF